MSVFDAQAKQDGDTPAPRRACALDALFDGPLDVLVIGGGIVGAGIARDAALRGLRVALLEKSDFASGTSSRSSRLLHGGLRYLAQGRIGLVCDASLEKTLLRGIAVGENDVLATWAGLRPLVAGSKGTPSDLSRSHQILRSQPGWYDVAGGKLTTYRLMAEQVVDRVMHELGRPLTACRTAELPLLGPDQSQDFSGITPPPLSEIAVRHFCHDEWAVHLDDVMFRRSGWGYWFTDRIPVAKQVAAWMARTLAWPPAVEATELERFTATDSGSGFAVASSGVSPEKTPGDR